MRGVNVNNVDEELHREVPVNVSACRVGDIVHYVPVLVSVPGCRAALVTQTHADPQVASLMVANPTSVQFQPEVRHAEVENYTWDRYEPGTWHRADHR